MCKLINVLNYIREDQRKTYASGGQFTLVKVYVTLKKSQNYSNDNPDYRTYEIWSDQPWFLEGKGILFGYNIKTGEPKDFRRFYTNNLIESIDIRL